MDSLAIFLRPRVPRWIWIRYIQYATHRNNFTSPQKWLCRLRCRIPLRHLVLILPLGNIFWRHARFSLKQPEPRNHGDFNVYFLKWQTWLLLHTANIPPSHVQQHALLSPLSHNFKSFAYFFPYYETCSMNVNSLFHAAIKNLHVKANGIFVFLLLHPPLLTTTIGEGIKLTRKNTFLRLKTITNIPLLAKNINLC